MKKLEIDYQDVEARIGSETNNLVHRANQSLAKVSRSYKQMMLQRESEIEIDESLRMHSPRFSQRT